MTNAKARFSKSLCPRKPEGSLGRTAQDGHLDSHTTPELWQITLKLRTIYKKPPPPPPKKKKPTTTHTHTKNTTSFQTKPVCQSLSVKNCCLTLHSVSGKLFFVCNQEIPICPVLRAWRTCFLFVCEELDPYMIFCLAHFQNLPQLAKVTEFNTDLNSRDRQTSSNVCLLKLKEKNTLKVQSGHKVWHL